MGEVEYAPGEPKGTPWHPHRGFETVTYMIDGTFEHSDSNGGGGVITNGDTQWMTAGAGHPPHREAARGARPERRALPRLPALGQPAGRPEVVAAALPGHPGAGGRPRLVARWRGARPVIAGDVAGHAGPGSTYSPMTLVHATLSPGATLTLPWRADYNALLYVMAGQGTVGPAGHPVRTGNSSSSAPGTPSRSPRQPSRSPGARTSRSSSSAGAPSASRSPGWARS